MKFDKKDEKTVNIINLDKFIKIGVYTTWCVFLEKESFLTASALDEVRSIQKGLNACLGVKKNG
jgi:hypothetical protein